MLDVDTRRRIDTARDVLVGKVPDPKSQVEQITIALIYKFMDDMDAENEEWGGEREFFAGEFEQYRWANLVRGGLGGHEMLNRYAEAITRMPENPRIPPLFRSIFNNAFLPYRDPETLRLFLREIDGFEYSDSEALGDAFEYLLSVLGSQGDAGQFRTPRHIIDFIVGILDPKKDESVLDPACGTAGFLISAYRHVLDANADGEGGSTLTPDERDRVVRNFTGYDISPDMVRLSLVNMYLHGFADPRIYEYDTLTSEERWGVHADVILANPPFMNPKGGIRPHKRFSVQSTRSEVLFVDYMAEHLTPNGRAGIIVPEGIIFQTQRAHTQLRRMLVQDYLVAVVSLPAGVFNPYSGVKTSILVLDKALARKTDAVAFFKVENDGYDLGAQRRPIDADDIPLVHAEIAEYLHRAAGESMDGYAPEHGFVVEKSRIAEGGDYNLSAERYREREERPSTWPMVRLGEVVDLIRGVTFRKSDQLEGPTEGSLAVATTKAAQEFGIVHDALYHIPRRLLKNTDSLIREGDILMSTANSLNLLGRTTHVREVSVPMAFGAFMTLLRPHPNILDGYLIHCLRTPQAFGFYRQHANTTTNISNLNTSSLASFQFPLPPLDVQREIVAEVEGYQRVIDGARAVLDAYRPHVPVDPSWPLVRLGDVAELARGVTYTKGDEVEAGGQHVLRANNIDVRTSALDLSEVKKVSIDVRFHDSKKLRANDIFICLASGSAEHIGKVALIPHDTDYYFGGFMGAIRVKRNGAQAAYLFNLLRQPEFNQFLRVRIAGASINNLSAKILYDYRIPLPSRTEQEAIAVELQAEEALVEANRDLIGRMRSRIASVVGRVWGEE